MEPERFLNVYSEFGGILKLDLAAHGFANMDLQMSGISQLDVGRQVVLGDWDASGKVNCCSDVERSIGGVSEPGASRPRSRHAEVVARSFADESPRSRLGR